MHIYRGSHWITPTKCGKRNRGFSGKYLSKKVSELCTSSDFSFPDWEKISLELPRRNRHLTTEFLNIYIGLERLESMDHILDLPQLGSPHFQSRDHSPC